MSQESNFQRALEWVLRWEGECGDDPQDPGGKTKWGITQRTYDEWRKAQKQSPEDVRNMTQEEAEAIYGTWYWNASLASMLPWPLCLVVFDTAVHCGVTRTRMWLMDGVWKVMGNPRAVRWQEPTPTQAKAIAMHILGARRVYYDKITKGNPKLQKFIRGWKRRVDALEREVSKA